MKKEERADRPDELADGGPESQVEQHSTEPPSGEVVPSDSDSASDKPNPYELRADGIFYRTPDGDGGFSETRLTNFGVKIVEEIILDDGVEQRRLFKTETLSGGARFRVPATSFASMAWVSEHLGAKAIIYPGVYRVKEHVAAAISINSEPTTRKVYAHTGWVRIDGAWVFLNAGGGLGPNGPVSGIEVSLPEDLEALVLPPLPGPRRLKKAFQASLRVVDLGPDEIVFPLLAATYLATLGVAQFTVFLAGRTGVFKTAIATIAQQHFGAGFSADRLPSNWSSTDNSIEGLASVAKDTLLVIDEFVPQEPGSRQQKMQAKADRVVRGVGNHSGRQRMTPSGDLRPTRRPRCLPLATGEELPLGQSLLARVFLLNLKKDDIDVDVLTECQNAASEGLLADAMSVFISNVAADYDAVQQRLARKCDKLRQEVTRDGLHRRTVHTIASLGCGLHEFLRIAVKSEALEFEEGRELWQRGWAGIQRAGDAQSPHQAEFEPAEVFLNLLRDALQSGRAFLLPADDEAPYSADIEGIGPRKRGDHIGWNDDDGIYLIPSAAYATISRLAREVGQSFPSQLTLKKRLAEKGILKRGDRGDERRLVSRKMICGTRIEVLHIDREAVFGDQDGEEYAGLFK